MGRAYLKSKARAIFKQQQREKDIMQSNKHKIVTTILAVALAVILAIGIQIGLAGLLAWAIVALVSAVNGTSVPLAPIWVICFIGLWAIGGFTAHIKAGD